MLYKASRENKTGSSYLPSGANFTMLTSQILKTAKLMVENKQSLMTTKLMLMSALVCFV